MQLQTIANSNNLTMSSREIAELTGKEHRNVMRDIRNMLTELYPNGVCSDRSTPLDLNEYHRGDRTQYKFLSKGTIDAIMDFSTEKAQVVSAESFLHTYINPQNGQSYPEFNLPKRECMILIAGYNITLRAKIIDRWQELEAQQQSNLLVLPNFTDPAEAAIAWATEYKAKQLALKQLEVAKPKVEFVDKFVERGTNRNITAVAKELGVTAIKLGKWLRAKGYMNKATDKQVWNKEFIDKGYGVQKLFNVEVQEEEFKSGSQALITPAGDVFIKEQIKQYGFTVEVK